MSAPATHSPPDEPEEVGTAADPEASEQSALGHLFRTIELQQEGHREGYRKAVGDPDYASRLREAMSSYLDVEAFKPGDTVTWKEGLRAATFPEYGAPACFVRYLDRRELRRHKADRVDHDCLIGFLDYEWDFVIIRASSPRLTHWQVMDTSNGEAVLG